MLKEELPFRCQPNTLGIAQKEAGMESVFQLLDGFADDKQTVDCSWYFLSDDI